MGKLKFNEVTYLGQGHTLVNDRARAIASATYPLTIRAQCPLVRDANHIVWYKLMVGVDVYQQCRENINEINEEG